MSYGQALKLAPAFQLNGRNTFDSGGQLFAPPPNPGCEVDGPCRGGLEPKIFGLRQQHRDGLTAPRDLYGLAILGAVQQLGEAITGVCDRDGFPGWCPTLREMAIYMAIIACPKSLLQLSLLPTLRVIADRRCNTPGAAP